MTSQEVIFFFIGILPIPVVSVACFLIGKRDEIHCFQKNQGTFGFNIILFHVGPPLGYELTEGQGCGTVVSNDVFHIRQRVEIDRMLETAVIVVVTNHVAGPEQNLGGDLLVERRGNALNTVMGNLANIGLPF